mgnify:CR=1 FL=1
MGFLRRHDGKGGAFIPKQRKTISGLTIAEPTRYDKAVSNLGLNAYEKLNREKNIETNRILVQYAGVNPTIDTMKVMEEIKSDQQSLDDIRIDEQKQLQIIQEQQQQSLQNN